MRIVRQKKSYKKTLKKYQNNAKVLKVLSDVIDFLANDLPIPEKYRDHELSGNYKGIRELHLFPDDLLMYFKIEEDELVLVAIGTHSELFG